VTGGISQTFSRNEKTFITYQKVAGNKFRHFSRCSVKSFSSCEDGTRRISPEHRARMKSFYRIVHLYADCIAQ
jgi:hypothetical protein